MTEKLYGYVIQYGLNIIAAILIFFIGKYVAVLAAKFTERLLRRGKINETLVAFTKNCVYFLIVTFVVIAALNKIGIETNSFLAVIGAAGLAVGLALQGSLANFAAGIMPPGKSMSRAGGPALRSPFPGRRAAPGGTSFLCPGCGR